MNAYNVIFAFLGAGILLWIFVAYTIYRMGKDK